jgi:hypothetical protein
MDKKEGSFVPVAFVFVMSGIVFISIALCGLYLLGI